MASDCWKACAVPWKLPWIVAGTPICCMVVAGSPLTASLSDLPGGRLNEMVVATNGPWWLTASGVVPGPKWLNADSGTMVSAAVLTAAPVEALPWPALAEGIGGRLARRAGGDRCAVRSAAGAGDRRCRRPRWSIACRSTAPPEVLT